MLFTIIVVLIPCVFYKNMLLSFMIVFLIANKISSFGVRGEEEDEEEERGRGRTEEWDGEKWTDQAVSFQSSPVS